jgi:CMP-N-acetylneuraminic acid synthetase/mannose-6-phosphate isomerase-like protein (cupin superfamily)
MKIVGMIPARLGSTRVKNKNLRLIDGKPLIQYIVDAAIGSSVLDEIYINSESLQFSDIAKKSGINFYHRDNELSSNEATNDDFSLDFLNNIECDILIQLLPTSPFVSSREVDDFVKSMLDGNFETMISVSNVQIESVYKGNPINFDQKRKTPPSQLLEPVQSYACALMGWEVNRFRKNTEKFNAAYHGGDGSIGFYELKGYSTIDIDHEEDFYLAEAVSEALKKSNIEPKYYESVSQKTADADRERILKEDGVVNNTLDDFNKEIVHIDEIIERNGRGLSWSHTLVNSLSTCSTLIAQMPGEGNRMHYHPDWDEWWYIVEGIWEWEIEGEVKTVCKNDIVFIHRNRKHKITAAGNKMAIRLAVSRADVDHVYENGDY